MYFMARKLDPKDCMLEEFGETPNGGVRTVAYFFDGKDRPCEESHAKVVQIIEYDKDDNVVFSIISHS